MPSNNDPSAQWREGLADLEAAEVGRRLPIGSRLTVAATISALRAGSSSAKPPSSVPGGMCDLAGGRVVEVQGYDREFGVLVSYDDGGSQLGRPAEGCAAGDLTFLSPSLVGTWARAQSDADQAQVRQRRVKEAVDRIMSR